MTMRDGCDDVLHTSPLLKTSSQSSRPTRDLKGVSYETDDHNSSSINGRRGSCTSSPVALVYRKNPQAVYVVRGTLRGQHLRRNRRLVRLGKSEKEKPYRFSDGWWSRRAAGAGDCKGGANAPLPLGERLYL